MSILVLLLDEIHVLVIRVISWSVFTAKQAMPTENWIMNIINRIIIYWESC